MVKRKEQIFLIGKDLNKCRRIGNGLFANFQSPDDAELETISVQTERDYQLLITQGCHAKPAPLAILVDGYVVMDDGSRSYPDRFIRNLKENLGYRGPIIACAEQPIINDHLIEVGATHRIGKPAPIEGLGALVTVEDIIEQATEIIRNII